MFSYEITTDSRGKAEKTYVIISMWTAYTLWWFSPLNCQELYQWMVLFIDQLSLYTDVKKLQ